MQIKPEKLPKHAAVIMDGNGRWADQHDLPRAQGHLEGAESARVIIETCARINPIKYLTLYTFSTENWSRPQSEVDFIMQQLVRYLEENKEKMHDEGVRFKAIGRISDLPEDVRKLVKATEEYTACGSNLTLMMALNYGARAEIVDACRALCKDAVNGNINPTEIDQATFQSKLYTTDAPDPDLLIRSGGEMRLSNFLLWQISYSEIYVTDVLWPDFKEDELMRAFNDYAGRERRFGGRETHDTRQ